jgi:hypothetical protein
MPGKIRNIASILLLLIFLFPSVIKLEHHHESFSCRAKSEKHLHESHEKCSICSLEFSVFSSGSHQTRIEKENPKDNYSNHYRSQSYHNPSQYSFSLRAPPAGQI